MGHHMHALVVEAVTSCRGNSGMVFKVRAENEVANMLSKFNYHMFTTLKTNLPLVGIVLNLFIRECQRHWGTNGMIANVQPSDQPVNGPPGAVGGPSVLSVYVNFYSSNLVAKKKRKKKKKKKRKKMAMLTNTITHITCNICIWNIKGRRSCNVFLNSSCRNQEC